MPYSESGRFTSNVMLSPMPSPSTPSAQASLKFALWIGLYVDGIVIAFPCGASVELAVAS